MAKLLYTLKLALMEQLIALLPQGTITTRHRWYLTGEMLPLALFSSKVPNDGKRALASAILEHKPADLPMHIPEQRFANHQLG